VKRALPVALLLAALASVILTRSTATAFPAQPIPSCSPGPADCSQWHTSDFTVSWSAPQCPSVAVTSDTGGAPVSCTASDANGSVTTTVIVRRDATPPSVRGKPARGPDSNGWYNGPVGVEFEGNDSLSGVAGCSSGTYGGPDSATARATGTCTDFAGNRGTGTLELKYDATAPTAAAKTDRKPDANGWFNHPVTVSFAGEDQTSGVDSCTPGPVLYKGPDTQKATMSGTCRDKAANTSQPTSIDLRYDTVPPGPVRLKVDIASRGIVLRWTASQDARNYAVVRRPGLGGKKPSTIYSGPKLTFTDQRGLTNGVKYRYTVTAYDEAGNGRAQVLMAQPKSLTTRAKAVPRRATPAVSTPALKRPGPGARVSAPPLLAWTAVTKATYYNVQVYRDGTKILSTWTRHPKFRLDKTWKYDGHMYRLSPGIYHWFVWPGYDLPAANRYGKLVGSRTFVVAGK
jgi:hypothetical protein